jgi:hypothetical protein
MASVNSTENAKQRRPATPWLVEQLAAGAQKGKSGHRGDIVLFELSVAGDIVTKSFANISGTIPIGAGNRPPTCVGAEVLRAPEPRDVPDFR